MKTMNWNLVRGLKLLAFASIAMGMLSGFTSCSSGSGSKGESNANAGGGGSSAGLTYSGPTALSADVTEFKINVWDNLVADNRCGGCHTPDGLGKGTPFVRDDDINLAYQAALTVADLDVPANSELVRRMNIGHHCWWGTSSVDLAKCAADMTNYIAAWAAAAQATATVINIQAPPPLEPDATIINFPSSSADFQTYVWTPITRQFCTNCHRPNAPGTQRPEHFASADPDVAYSNAKRFIDLNNPAGSRFVTKVASIHNCWDPNSTGAADCAASSQFMLNQITAWANALAGTATSLDTSLLPSSKAVEFPSNPAQGQSANTKGRFETNIIAKYEFKPIPGDPTYVGDSSVVQPAMPLTLSGSARLLDSWGVEFSGANGRAQALTSGSRKLYDQITLTGEFAIEAWVIPNNVTQDNTRRIVSYSGGTTERNFTLGQTLYDYDTLLRTDDPNAPNSGANGDPLYSTPTADEVLQANLQHVVMNYNSINGRQIFVNGVLRTTTPDTLIGRGLSNWNNSFVFVLGNEAGGVGNTDWRGILRFVAIHKRTLTPEQIAANADAGVGQKYFLPFRIGHLLSDPSLVDAYIVFEVEQYDDYSYLFSDPFFTVVGASPTFALPAGGIHIQNMRIGLNGAEATSGQAYAKMDITITDADFQAAENRWVRLLDIGAPVRGTIVEKSYTPNDVFFLTFDVIDQRDSSGYVRAQTEADPKLDLKSIDYIQSDIGIKHFYEINEMYHAVTGVAKDNATVATAFGQLKTQLPTVEDPIAFGAANQMGIAQFAAAYCTALVADSGLRNAMWPGYNFNAPMNTVPQRSALVDPLLQKLAAHDIQGGGPLAGQAPLAGINAAMDRFLNEFTPATTGNNNDGLGTATAVCTAVLASASANIQ